MAKIISLSLLPHSIEYKLSGTLGDQVWVYKNGVNYVRSKPAKSSKPRTEMQLAHQARFAVLLKFLKPLTAFLREGFKNQSTTMSAFNAAMGCNYRIALMGSYPDFAIDYSKVMVSKGKLPEAINPAVRLTRGWNVEFSWEDNSFDFDARPDDKAMLVVYNEDKQEVLTVIGGNTRASGSQSIELPSSFLGAELQCYISFQNARQTVVSDSRFVGTLVVL